MLKRFWFQAHWLIGITAGVVLAIVGLTGGVLAFETQLQNWLNRDVRRVEAAGTRLSPTALLQEIQRQHPDKRIQSLAIASDPTDAVRVTFAPERAPGAPAGAEGRGGPRGETRYVNPYTGEVNPDQGNRGQGFFRGTRSLHRWLVAGSFGNQEFGKQLVGASTILCVVLTLSGLYLRWPRRRRLSNWRVWLTFDPALKGRSFLWHLHAVIGTWVLVAFLLMSLTGLYWSYDWYRNGLFSLAGVEPPQRGEQREGPAMRGGERRGEDSRALAGGGREGGRNEGSQAASTAVPFDLDRVWATFEQETATQGFRTATLTLPQNPSRPLEIRYIDKDPAHERASSTLAVHATTGNVVRHERYDAKRVGEKFMASIFALHSGSFFGLPGVIVYMLASLSMPIFAVTGWMLYLDRRATKRAVNAVRAQA